MKELILKYALQNAVLYKGKANEKAVLGKVFSENPDVRKNAKEVIKQISETVKQVNSMKPDEQKEKLEELAPELLKKKKVKQRDIFGFLNVKGKVVTAFPPEPSKYLHIGHAKALFLNYELAKKNKGEFILRFEDTNPTLAKKEFYDIIPDDVKWLGVKPDKIDYASKHMDKFYKHAEDLVKKGNAYVCLCNQDMIKEGRAKGAPCKDRTYDVKKNLELWKKMFSMKKGEANLRLKIDLEHQNTTMRDPTIIRIIDEKHVLQGAKYRLWPTYDFENSVMDGVGGITYRLRSKEFELRNELQRYIQKLLGFKETNIYEFGRMNLEGVESSGRVIREKIEKKELLGWDDPSLTTLIALRRRGFLPEAIKSFVLSTGISKAEATLTWDDFIMHNKRILDFKCNRYFFVEDPVKISVKNAPSQDVKLKLHPEDEKRGFRDFKTGKDFYITKKDHKELKKGKLYRLMDCLNFKDLAFDSRDHSEYKGKGEKIIHWLPVSKDLVEVEVMMPDKSVKKGLAESLKLKIGDVIQFERFGFCKLDQIKAKKYVFWFTHG
ncbi:glutamate--tRNA ligase [Candidatus Woesearchaeota archaeon]|nr:glutamate--tRNA ligase [Candidatus Woesearchaeota archaeon]